MAERRLAGLALLVCLLGLVLSACGSTPSRRLEDDLTKALYKGKREGRVDCESYRPRLGLWSCRVELDPGSGFGARVLVKADKDGCWRARYTGGRKAAKSAPPSRSFAGFRSFGRTFRGCTDLDA